MTGPLDGVVVVEFGGEGPGPHAAMQLADLGATVTRIDRPGPAGFPDSPDHLLRGRHRILTADLKDPADLASVRELLAGADVLIDVFRPGVLERLGLGPDDLHPRLVYARMTGWGQTGPWAKVAGHDINFLSVTGALHAIGTAEAPVPPLNLLGDYGGGSAYLVGGVLAALYRRERTGVGGVVDVAILDGVLNLMQIIWQARAAGTWSDERADNLLDGGAPFYRCYECADGRHVALGSLEPRFFALAAAGLGLDPVWVERQYDRRYWPELARRIAGAFAGRTRDEWAAHFAGTDACVTPVLAPSEAAGHPQVAARELLVPVPGGRDGAVAAAPAPRMSLRD
ncbi:CaiB/BaiF CoA transferase family protein [Nakamurella alba]|uniref:CaiB/BaiF CoA transferase family protein n=1 Tax=Nakamurella alba TaxID=2665158 RepID=UPI002AC3332F|nr:CaiB/BaiF CoA-transferase family protein [Nakamurella alba]